VLYLASTISCNRSLFVINFVHKLILVQGGYLSYKRVFLFFDLIQIYHNKGEKILRRKNEEKAISFAFPIYINIASTLFRYVCPLSVL
jgi:hypothetical protein